RRPERIAGRARDGFVRTAQVDLQQRGYAGALPVKAQQILKTTGRALAERLDAAACGAGDAGLKLRTEFVLDDAADEAKRTPRCLLQALTSGVSRHHQRRRQVVLTALEIPVDVLACVAPGRIAQDAA